MSKLIMGNELELAVSVGMALKGHCSNEYFETAARLLARKCEKLSKWYGDNLAKSINNDTD